MNKIKHKLTKNDFERIYTLRQVASILHVGRVTTLRLVWCSKLRGFKVGRAWRIRREDLERFMRPQTAAKRETGRILTAVDHGEGRKR
jgi:excisionase family DNA binding protein